MSVNNLSFNSLYSHLTCSTNDSYIIYSLIPSLEKKVYTEWKDGITMMKMFKRTNIALIIGKAIDTVILWNADTKTKIIEINVHEPIKNALMAENRVIIVLDKLIRIFDWDGHPIYIKETYPNPDGLCAIASDQNNLILTSQGMKEGEIIIWNLTANECKTIDAHKTKIVSICINNIGTLIASASETGTLIRVFDTIEYKPVYEFRRGTSTALIHDMCFNKNSTKLVCCSNNGTVHIFHVYVNIDESKNTESMLSTFKNYLPTYFSSQWGYKQVNIVNTNKSICAFDNNDNIHIATYDGNYYKLNENNIDNIIHSSLHVTTK